MVWLIKVIDRVLGTLICGILGIWSRPSKVPSLRKILFIQLWGIGETILTLPAIKAVGDKYPRARLSVLCTERNKDVYNAADLNLEVLDISMNMFSIIGFIQRNWKRFDVVVDFEEYLNISAIISFFTGRFRVGFGNQVRSRLYSRTVGYDDQKHTVKTFYDLVGILGIKGEPNKLVELRSGKEEKERVEALLAEEGVQREKLIALVPGAAESAKSRMWPWKRFVKLGQLLSDKARIILVGAEYERKLIEGIQKEIPESISTVGKLSLRDLFYLIKRVDLVISNDTGPMHIAAAQATPVIGFFGPNLPTRFGPFSEKGVSIYHRMECSPCINTHLGQIPDCYWKGKDYQKCMKRITVEEVLKAAWKML